MLEFVRNAYRAVLRRDPDDEALAWATAQLESGALSRAGLVAELAASDEFARLRALEDAFALAGRARSQGIRPRELTAPAGSDERLIEMPWVLARYTGEPRVVDVGYANAAPAYLEALVAAAPGEVIGLDPIEADVPGVRPVAGDLRALPFDDASVDVLLCVSTIEHVGRDNRVYGSGEERDEAGIPEALHEIARVLAPAGRALLTVPTGAEEDHGWFVQLPVAAWRGLFARAGLAVSEDEVYELGDDGWHATAGEAEGLQYRSRGPAASAVYCVELVRVEQPVDSAPAEGA
ncbi:MAG: methyltransferase domain-containing protein [Gaiellaceae bacterium]